MAPNSFSPQSVQSGKISLPLLLALVLGLLILSGAAVAATYFLMSNQDETAAKAEPVKAPVPDPIFVTINPFTINLKDDSGRVLYTRISIQVANDAAAKQLTDYMPQVRNRILLTVSDRRADVLVTSEGKRQLAATLREQMTQPLTAEGDPIAVDDVLFTDFIVQ